MNLFLSLIPSAIFAASAYITIHILSAKRDKIHRELRWELYIATHLIQIDLIHMKRFKQRSYFHDPIIEQTAGVMEGDSIKAQ